MAVSPQYITLRSTCTQLHGCPGMGGSGRKVDICGMRSIIVWNRNLGFFRNSYNYVALVVPILIVAPMFMSGQMPFGVVTQTLGAFAQVLGAVSIIAGTLRDQLHYPDHEHGADDKEIRRAIESVNLTDVLARVDDDLDRVIDWTNVLSLGEQQRVAFARLFLRQPKFVFLDEATSALDEDNQRRIYELVIQSGIGFISVGHRETLVQFHQRVLRLKNAGEWELTQNPSGSFLQA